MHSVNDAEQKIIKNRQCHEIFCHESVSPASLTFALFRHYDLFCLKLTDFSENLRSSLINKDLLNEPSFSQIYLAEQYF
jgi:hypothetical protein